jgi:predicted nucleotidyltransferase
MLNKDFKEFVALLNSTGVEYLIVGAYALAAHGHPRYTGDLDVWLRRTDGNIDKVLAALNRFGFGDLGLKQADFLGPDAVVQLGYPPARIDLLTAIDGVEFDACYGRKVVVKMDGIDLPFIGLEEFRANKRAAGRKKDLADLESLEQSKPEKR